MTLSKEAKVERLLPEGKPRYVRCYDAGPSRLDRYTVVFTGNYTMRTDGQRVFLQMSSEPYSMFGYSQTGGVPAPQYLDRPKYSHLGKYIDFDEMPPECQDATIEDYVRIWGLDVEWEEHEERE